MAINDFSNQYIQDTYQRVVQTAGTYLADGTGSALPIKFEGNDIIVPGAVRAQSYIVSESIVNVSSGSTIFGDSTDDTHRFIGDISASNISSSGNINFTGTSGKIELNGSSGFIIQAAQIIANQDIRTGDGKGIKFGVGSDYRIQHAGTATNETKLSIKEGTTTRYTFGIGGHLTASSNVNIQTSQGGEFRGNSANITNITSSLISASNSIQTPILKGDSTQATGLQVDGFISASNITASGNISASGNVFANSATVQGGLEVAMGGTSSDGIKILGGGGGTQAFLTNINGLRLQPTTQDPSQPDTPHVTIGVGGHITASGDISASGDIIANNINQSVKTTNSPTFASLILSDIAIDYRPTRDISGSLAYDATQTFNMGPKYGARLTVTGMPNVGADQLVTGIVVKNERVREHTIILANSNSAFTVQPFGIKSGQFVLNLRTGFKEYTASDFPSGFVINIALFGV